MNERLDPQVVELLAALPQGPFSAKAGADVLRRDFDALIDFLHPTAAEPFRGEKIDGTVAGVSVRTYLPANAQSSDVVAFFHGGGWVLGDVESADAAAASIAESLGVRVVSVGYRLAPEHPYPAAFLDCLAVTSALADENPRWLAVAGDSAGGNLAAAVALAARGEFRLDAQLLFYPALDRTMGLPSHQEFGEGHLLTGPAMTYYWEAYQGDGSGSEETFSPTHAVSLVGLPPTVIASAGNDPLKDEGVEFAARLIGDGIETTFLPFPSLIHGWLDQADRVEAAASARSQAVATLAAVRQRHIAASR